MLTREQINEMVRRYCELIDALMRGQRDVELAGYDSDPAVFLLYVCRVLTAAMNGQRTRSDDLGWLFDTKRAVQFAEIIADSILDSDPDKLQGFGYGQRPANMAQVTYSVMQFAGVTLTKHVIIIEEDKPELALFFARRDEQTAVR